MFLSYIISVVKDHHRYNFKLKTDLEGFGKSGHRAVIDDLKRFM